MGTSLREFKRRSKGRKLSDGKGVGGLGRLTDSVINSMQNYYGFAIRNNKGNLIGMKNAVLAIFQHTIKDDAAPLQEQHALCPREKGT